MVVARWYVTYKALYSTSRAGTFGGSHKFRVHIASGVELAVPTARRAHFVLLRRPGGIKPMVGAG